MVTTTCSRIPRRRKVVVEEAVRLVKRNTRHYAKKQLTYWGRDNSIERQGANHFLW